jgi:hypothetical protein
MEGEKHTVQFIVPHPEYLKDPSNHDAQNERRLLHEAIKTITFYAMAMEAAVFYLAAIHLTDRYAEQYLDKLNLVAKWHLVPSKSLSIRDIESRGRNADQGNFSKMSMLHFGASSPSHRS